MNALPATRNPGLSPALRQASRQVLTFGLGDETYALEIRHIREILQYESLTAVPLLPPSVRGIINLRGTVVPVLDLKVRLGRTSTEPTRRTCIVIAETSREQAPAVIGLLVDQVSEVIDLPASDIDPPPGFTDGASDGLVRGVGKVQGGFVLLLDADHLADARLLGGLQLSAPESPSSPSPL